MEAGVSFASHTVSVRLHELAKAESQTEVALFEKLQ
jgi:hypothetical protein